MPVPYSFIDVSSKVATSNVELNRTDATEEDARLEALLTEALEEAFPAEELQYSFRFD